MVMLAHNALPIAMSANEASLNSYLNQPITDKWCQPIGGHVSYPT